MNEFKLLIPDMSCKHCVNRITEAVEEKGGKIEDADLDTKLVEIKTPLSKDELLASIDDAGYGSSVVQ